MAVTLSDSLIREAAIVGLTPAAIERMVQAEIMRRHVTEPENKLENDSLAEFYAKLDSQMQLGFSDLVKQFNEAYSIPDDEDEQALVNAIAAHQRYLWEMEGGAW